MQVSRAGELFEDTQARGKPIVFVYGSRPFTGGMNEGVERALATMKTGAAGVTNQLLLMV